MLAFATASIRALETRLGICAPGPTGRCLEWVRRVECLHPSEEIPGVEIVRTFGDIVAYVEVELGAVNGTASENQISTFYRLPGSPAQTLGQVELVAVLKATTGALLWSSRVATCLLGAAQAHIGPTHLILTSFYAVSPKESPT